MKDYEKLSIELVKLNQTYLSMVNKYINDGFNYKEISELQTVIWEGMN